MRGAGEAGWGKKKEEIEDEAEVQIDSSHRPPLLRLTTGFPLMLTCVSWCYSWVYPHDGVRCV